MEPKTLMSFVTNPFAEDDEGEIDADDKEKNSLIYDFSRSAHGADYPSASIFSLDIFSDYDHFHKENYFNALIVIQRKVEHDILVGKTNIVAEEFEKLQQYRAELSAIDEKFSKLFQSRRFNEQTVSGSFSISDSLLPESGLGKVDRNGSDSFSLCDKKLFMPRECNLVSTAKACHRKNQSMILSSEKNSILSTSFSCASPTETLKDDGNVFKETSISSESSSEKHPTNYGRKTSATTLSSSNDFDSAYPSRHYAFSKTNMLWLLLKNIYIMLHYCTTGAKNVSHTSNAENMDKQPLIILMRTLSSVLLEEMSHQVNECRENIEATGKLSDACKRLESCGESFPLIKNMALDSETQNDAQVSFFFLEKEIEMTENLDDTLYDAHQLINSVFEVQTTKNATAEAVSAEKESVSSEMLDDPLIGHVVDVTSKTCRLHELIKEATNLGCLVRQLRKEVSCFSFAAKRQFFIRDESDQINFVQKNAIECFGSGSTITRVSANKYKVLSEVQEIVLLRKFAVDLSHRIYELLNEPGNVFLPITASRNSEQGSQKDSSFLKEAEVPECLNFTELQNNFETCPKCLSKTSFLCAEVGLLSIFVGLQDACLHVIAHFHHLLLQIAHTAFFRFYLALNQDFTPNEEYMEYSNNYCSASAGAWSNLRIKPAAEEKSFDFGGQAFVESEEQTFLGVSETLLRKLHEICNVSSAASTSESDILAVKWGRLRRKLQAHSVFFHSSIEKNNASSSDVRSSTMLCMEDRKRRRSFVDDSLKNVNTIPIKPLRMTTYSMLTTDSKTSSDIISFFKVLDTSNNLLHLIVNDGTFDGTRERLSTQQQKNRKEDYNAAVNEIESVTEKVRGALQIRQEEATKRMKWLQMQSFGPYLLELVELEEKKIALEILCEQLEDSLKADDYLQDGSHDNDNSEDDEKLREEFAEALTLWAETEEQFHISVKEN